MSTPAEHLTQGVEELRGDLTERSHGIYVPGAAAAGGVTKTAPLFLDGRLANVSAAAYSGAGGRGDVGGILRRVQVVPAATLTGQATNFVTINVRRLNGGVVQATLATVVFNTGAVTWPIEQPTDLGVNNITYNPGDVIDVQYVGTGTGLLVPDCLYEVEMVRFGV